jgi:hypothetical protein
MIDSNQDLSQAMSLTFTCKNLPNMDTFSRSDGMAVLYEKRGANWVFLGMTEVIQNSLNPEWVQNF